MTPRPKLPAGKGALRAAGKRIAALGRRVLEGARLDRPELLDLAACGQARPRELIYWGGRVREDRFGNAVKLCSIVAGKLHGCGEDCRWCAQSALSCAGKTPPQRTSAEDILAAARQARQAGASCIGIVNSGRRPAACDLGDVASSAAGILAESAAGFGVCASLGELSDRQAERLAAAGIRRYNHNLETSRRFYPRVVTTHTIDDRLATLAAARRAGLSLCCGGIFGLGETWEDRVDLAIMLRDEVRPDVTPLNFLHPIPGTPLEHAAPLPAMEILTIIAFFRLAMPEADLKIAGGREKNLRDLQSWMFAAGATSCLIGNYLTTAGRPAEEDLRMIADLGLTVVREIPGPAAPNASPPK